MTNIFISYRREDSSADAGRLYDKLSARIGKNAEMPCEEDLPPSLVKLTRRNAIEISYTRWDYDTEKLIYTIRRINTISHNVNVPAVNQFRNFQTQSSSTSNRSELTPAFTLDDEPTIVGPSVSPINYATLASPIYYIEPHSESIETVNIEPAVPSPYADCPYCGASNIEGALFCRNCGNRLRGDECPPLANSWILK